jgi:hypothetical protein
LGIALYHRKREDIKHRVIGIKKAIFIVQVVSIPDRHTSKAMEPDGIDNLGEILDEIVGHGRTGFGNIEEIPRNFQFRPQSEYLVGIFVELIVAQLMENVSQNQYAARNTDPQTGNVDKGKSFVFSKIDKGDFQVVFKHSNLLDGKSAINMPVDDD